MTLVTMLHRPLLRAAGAALLLASVLGSSLHAEAAPLRPFEAFRQDNGGRAPFNIDPNPCPPPAGQRHLRSERPGEDCFYPGGNAGRNNWPRHPGSSAFGLQFNSGED